MRGTVISGIGSYLPENIMTNEVLSELVDTNDEWIRTRTGIEQRHISTGENTSDLGYKAAQKALEDAKLKPDEIDLIICATITPDCFMPSCACLIQQKLGANNAVSFDISAACTGFIYALTMAEQFIKSGTYSKVLVIGAETFSKIVDWKDRSTCILFGDGAGAVVLQASEDNSFIASELRTDASKSDLLICSAVALNNTYFNAENTKNYVTMKGSDVFKFAVKSIVETINAVLDKANLKIENIGYIVPHQANIRIIESAAGRLNIPQNKFFTNLRLYGNTSSASVAIALDELAKSKALKKNDYVILAGFGGGMTSGAILLKWHA